MEYGYNMKIKFLIVILFLLFITGCGEKRTLTCSRVDDEGKTIFTIDFEGSTVDKMNMKYIAYLDKDDDAEEIKESLEKQLQNDTYYDSDIKVYGNRIEVTAYQKADNLISDPTYEGFKKYLENDSFTCK